MIADTINAGFEFAAAFAVLHHCWHAWRDKEVKGTSIAAVAFFAAWGIWNLFYYPHLGQLYSFFAGIFVFGANTLWLLMLVRYRRQRVQPTISHGDPEDAVMQHLVDAWNAHLSLPDKHPDANNEFRLHIHALQNMIDARRFRRPGVSVNGASHARV